MEWQPFCSDAQAIQMWSPYGFLDVKITEKKLYCLSLLLLLLWGFTEQLINISAIVLFVQSRATFYIPSYWPCQQSQAIQNQWFFFLWKVTYLSPSLVKPSEQQEMEEEKERYLWWTNVCSFLKDLRKKCRYFDKMKQY